MLQAIRKGARRTAAATLIAFTSLVLAAPAAQAGIVGTQPALAGATLDAPRAHLLATLARDDVRAQLVQRGVDPTVVEARVAALTDDQVRQINDSMDKLPAGGDGVLGILLFVFVLLLITDLLGWTDVFPFTKKGALAK